MLFLAVKKIVKILRFDKVTAEPDYKAVPFFFRTLYNVVTQIYVKLVWKVKNLRSTFNACLGMKVGHSPLQTSPGQLTVPVTLLLITIFCYSLLTIIYISVALVHNSCKMSCN